MGNLKDRIDEEDWEKIEGARADLHRKYSLTPDRFYKGMCKPLLPIEDEATNISPEDFGKVRAIFEAKDKKTLQKGVFTLVIFVPFVADSFFYLGDLCALRG